MQPHSTPRLLGVGALVLLMAAASSTVYGHIGSTANAAPSLGPAALSTPSETTFVAAPPSWATGPDDLTALALPGLDQGRTVIWTAYQNHINPDGTPGTSGGPTKSTVVGYDRATGGLVRSLNVTGKVDGLTADPALGKLIATVNEDDHSALNLIDPASGAVSTYSYAPDPAVHGNGGTDSIAILGGHIYLAHSNPNDTTQAAEYLVSLHRATRIAHLTPVFFDDSTATDPQTGAAAPLALTDPDTNLAMPAATPHFGGDLATVSQGDGKIIFASHLGGTPHLSVLNLSDNVTGNVPPIDGLAVATCQVGTLFVVDAKAGSILALATNGWRPGTVFVGEPNDNGNPLVGTLNLSSGNIAPFGNHFASPKGLLFIPGGCHTTGGDRGHGHDGGDREAGDGPVGGRAREMA